ncbi:MAG TPA: DUF72 domain-containing protein [Candidatus Dormibacteraeota bacterium]|nr:DUF72 domain-containing protein [Candidatus Dormibacteraeota bacterium]
MGTSGWQYPHWRRVFYPEKLPPRMWLPYYAERFQTVEVNNTFYNLPERSVFEHWRTATPPDFVFALKMSRFLTHLKRLRDPEQPVRLFLDHAAGMEDKRGPILMQLPPRFRADVPLLQAALERFDTGIRVAVEFRDESWFTAETRAVLESRGVALCLADSPRRKQPVWRTAGWGFVRFHEGSGRDAPGYERDALRRWIARLAETYAPDEDVYAYFNNDAFGYAIKDAVAFAELASAAGLSPTRVPPSTDAA